MERVMMQMAMACLAAAMMSVDDPLDDFDWVIVGDPGNRPANQAEAPWFYPPFIPDPGWRMGRVDYPYRIMRTEVTVAQWFEFVNAYWPHYEGNVWESSLTGSFIYPLNSDPGPGEDPEYVVIGDWLLDVYSNMSWQSAARYCNWLHNGKVNEAWAFETGVYDTSTWGVDEDGHVTDHPGHLPGARVWISTANELIKAGYYDPDRYGPGEPGYWLFPNSSNEPLQGGWPWEDGSETSAGIDWPDSPYRYVPVGSYPEVTSPWGLLDVSGGDSEWLEDLFLPSGDRAARGSWHYIDPFANWDRVDRITGHSPGVSFCTIRLVSPVTLCAADVNGDGSLNVLDVIELQRRFQSDDPRGDLNGDGRLSVLDWVAFHTGVLTSDDGLSTSHGSM